MKQGCTGAGLRSAHRRRGALICGLSQSVICTSLHDTFLAWDFLSVNGAMTAAPRSLPAPTAISTCGLGSTAKVTIITIAMTMLDAVRNPEATIAIFSFNRPLAKAFLRKIKLEFESNELLKEIFSDACWRNPKEEAPKWAEDEGLCLKRRAIRVEQTIEAWGLVDGQPTGRHFEGEVFDDILTIDNSRSAEMIQKVIDALQQAHNTSSRGGWKRYVGTLYNEADAYSWLSKQGIAKVRRYPVLWDEGPLKGEPCFFDWPLVLTAHAGERQPQLGLPVSS